MSLIKNSAKFNSLVKEMASILFKKYLGEITTTASVDAYQSPATFSSAPMNYDEMFDDGSD